MMADPAAYWGRVAREEVHWFRPFEVVVEGDGPNARWFLGGQTNICYNALDRHADGERRNKAALIWLSEDGGSGSSPTGCSAGRWPSWPAA
ncbi:MAG: hypothetical protein A6D92_16205 [Symbiobacterium thermophilum]|uniref:Acetyl-coenzyme A synthetase N-terminal domain-containing protein n=1 Tax=Symbiobacterium thermophilum TaxID=2734 RepID=A0A1Y2T2G4_SYMTR|nr:MAG: hypothetical protein A6D92_16205 [Symbiobacterium thermophilum]